MALFCMWFKRILHLAFSYSGFSFLTLTICFLKSLESVMFMFSDKQIYYFKCGSFKFDLFEIIRFGIGFEGNLIYS